MSQGRYTDGMEFSPGEEGALFDMSVATLTRIHYALMQGNYYSSMHTSEGIQGWYSALCVIDRELGPFLSETDEKELETVRSKSKKIPVVISNRKINFNYWNMSSMLDEYERSLRKYLNKYKLYMKKREDPGRAMLQ